MIPFSLRMWKWAAKQSNVYANLRVGDMYYYGLQGIQIDMSKAVKHYHRASNFGSPQSMFNLGWHYQYGVGVRLFYFFENFFCSLLHTASNFVHSSSLRYHWIITCRKDTMTALLKHHLKMHIIQIFLGYLVYM